MNDSTLNATQRRASILETATLESVESETTLLRVEKGDHRPLIIGVAGGAGSGMHQLCSIVVEHLNGATENHSRPAKIQIIRLGDFYRPLTVQEKKAVSEYNFDHPDSLDWPLVDAVLLGLLEGEEVHIPSWDAAEHERLEQWTSVYRPDVVFFVGIFMLYKKRIRDVLDIKIFVEADPDGRLSRHLLFDTERKVNPLSVDEIIQRYMRFVKPAHEDFVAPSKKTADIIFPRSFENTVAIEVLAQHIKDALLNPTARTFSKTDHLSVSLQEVNLREAELREWYQPLDSRASRKSVAVEVPK
jgi:uridine kinase